jgi:putative transcriptional regulator
VETITTGEKYEKGDSRRTNSADRPICIDAIILDGRDCDGVPELASVHPTEIRHKCLSPAWNDSTGHILGILPMAWTSSMKNDLKSQRTQHDLTQEQLARAIDVTRQTINSIERERYDPSLELAFKLARYFDCRIEELFQPDLSDEVG